MGDIGVLDAFTCSYCGRSGIDIELRRLVHIHVIAYTCAGVENVSVGRVEEMRCLSGFGPLLQIHLCDCTVPGFDP